MTNTSLIKERTISAENQFTDVLVLPHNRVYHITALVTGATFTFTPTIQFRKIGESAWTDVSVNNFPALDNAGDERQADVSGPIEFRLGVKTGNFTDSTDGTLTIQAS